MPVSGTMGLFLSVELFSRKCRTLDDFSEKQESDIQQILQNVEVFWKSGLDGGVRVEDMRSSKKYAPNE